MQMEKYEVLFAGGVAIVAAIAEILSLVWFPINPTFLAVSVLFGVVLFTGVALKELTGRSWITAVLLVLVMFGYSETRRMFSGNSLQGGCLMLAVFGSLTWLFLRRRLQRAGAGLAGETKKS